MTPDQKLESLGFPLDRKLTAGAIYRPVVIDGTTAYVSGCVPFDGDKNLVSKGKVRSQVSVRLERGVRCHRTSGFRSRTFRIGGRPDCCQVDRGP